METAIILIKDELQYNLQYQFFLFRDFDMHDSEFQIIMDDEFVLNVTKACMTYKNLDLFFSGIRDKDQSKVFWAIRMFRKGCLSKDCKGYIYEANDGYKKVIMPLTEEEKEKNNDIKSQDNYEKASVKAENLKTKEDDNLFAEVSNKYPELCAKIVDDDWFKFYLSSLYDEFETDKSISLQYFIEKYLEAEKCALYIEENISYCSLLKYFPEIKNFLMTEKDINIFLEKEIGIDIHGEVFDEDEDWLFFPIDYEKKLTKILKDIFRELCEEDERLRIEYLKEKYTVEYVLSLYKEEIEQIENFSDMKDFLSKFLSSHKCKSEIDLKRQIKDFFCRYKKHEREYDDFLRRHNDWRYVMEYSTQKEAKYHVGKYGADEKEKALFFNEAMRGFWEHYGTPESTRLRLNLPFWVNVCKYLTDFIKELLRVKVLKEENGEIDFFEIENLKMAKKEVLYYSTWCDIERGRVFIEDFSRTYEHQREIQRERLKERILEDERFYICSNRTNRLKYLRQIILAEYEAGNDNYFYCLDAYQQKHLGVCFRGKVASNFIDTVWKEKKKQ